MATVFKHSNLNQARGNLYSSAEMITLVIGFMMMILSMAGIFNPKFLGLSLSPMHALVLGGSGALAVWSGLFRQSNMSKAYKVNLILGVFFAANAIGGVLLSGATLDRTMFNEELIRRLAPGFLELTFREHIMHGLIAIWFLLDAVMWKIKKAK